MRSARKRIFVTLIIIHLGPVSRKSRKVFGTRKAISITMKRLVCKAFLFQQVLQFSKRLHLWHVWNLTISLLFQLRTLKLAGSKRFRGFRETGPCAERNSPPSIVLTMAKATTSASPSSEMLACEPPLKAKKPKNRINPPKAAF